MSETVHGYKVFNPDWTCRGFRYEVGKTFSDLKKPKICKCGFHFCKKPADCFKYYDFDPDNKIAEVEATGEIDTDGIKTCTNRIKILREVSWEEVLNLVNTGKSCTGLCNSGSRNSGDCNSGNLNSGNWNSGSRNSGSRNSGDCNSGNWNSGHWNSGNLNSGNWNSGSRNSGSRNSGDCNSGNWNSGNWNSGDWNNTSFSSGCFNTQEAKILMFNKPSDWTFQDWRNSDARRLLEQIEKDVVGWINFYDMTDEEKKNHPEAETTGGYLKVLDESENAQIWWDDLTEYNRNIIKALPNFDKEIFEQIVGVKI